ncbi:MAG: hypothetical protein PHC56_11380 [Herbinix sp.]|nr:hypothetical protein [Herbinix sp.]
MDLLFFILCVALGFLLSGIWFGLCLVIVTLTQKVKISWLSYLDTALASIIPILLISTTMGIYPFQASGIHDIKVYFTAFLTVLITIVIVAFKKTTKSRKGKDLLLWGIDGMLMEIPQRLMMQSFVYGILKLLGVLYLTLYTVIATALIWCLAIGMQTVLSKKTFSKDVFIDVLASFVFSLGIGYVYQQTGFILISMIAHFSERIVSCYVASKRIAINKE